MFIKVCSKLNVFLSNTAASIRKYPMLAVAASVVTTAGGFYIESKFKEWFPQFDDTLQIIDNQNLQFKEVNENIAKLQNVLDGNGAEVLSALIESYENAYQASQSVAAGYHFLKEENDALRQVLKKEKGLEGGFDILLPEGQGYKIDNAVSFGNARFDYTGGYFSLTSLTEGEDVRYQHIKVGEGLRYTNEEGAQCAINLIGISQKDAAGIRLGKYSVQCKKKQ